MLWIKISCLQVLFEHYVLIPRLTRRHAQGNPIRNKHKNSVSRNCISTSRADELDTSTELVERQLSSPKPFKLFSHSRTWPGTCAPLLVVATVSASPLEGLGSRGFVRPPWLRFADRGAGTWSVFARSTSSTFCARQRAPQAINSRSNSLYRFPGSSGGPGGPGFRGGRGTGIGRFRTLVQPDARARTSILQRDLRVSKAVTTFARYPDRWPVGLSPSEDGSLDVHQIWLHWRWQNLNRHGKRPFLFRSDAERRTWVSVAASRRAPRARRHHRPSQHFDKHVPGPSVAERNPCDGTADADAASGSEQQTSSRSRTAGPASCPRTLLRRSRSKRWRWTTLPHSPRPPTRSSRSRLTTNTNDPATNDVSIADIKTEPNTQDEPDPPRGIRTGSPTPRCRPFQTRYHQSALHRRLTRPGAT